MNKLCEICLYDNLPSKTKTIKKNEHIFYEGDPIKYIFIIKKGLVKISKVFINGDEKILDILAPGDFIALLTILKEQNEYIVTATAISKVELTVISKDDALKAYKLNNNFKDACLTCAANRVGVFQNQLFESLNQNTEEKILNILTFLFQKFGSIKEDKKQMTLPISKTELASIIGIRRETLSRKLSILEENNKIKITKNTYQLLSM